jgi:hypothetical protein
MFGSTVFYVGVIVAFVGLAAAVKPIRHLRLPTRSSGLAVMGTGVVFAGVGLTLPATGRRVDRAETRLDAIAPAWQFREFHSIRVAAPPTRVFEAIKSVRADEILFFHALTWIRRAGRPLPKSIMNPGTSEPLIDVATQTGFVRLADDAPRELVVGSVVMAPARTRGTATPQMFARDLPPGFALATMNFLVTEDGPDRSLVSTETRVFANSPAARRRFAMYWRMIYPGSAIIRRMWLRAIERRATRS